MYRESSLRLVRLIASMLWEEWKTRTKDKSKQRERKRENRMGTRFEVLCIGHVTRTRHWSNVCLFCFIFFSTLGSLWMKSGQAIERPFIYSTFVYKRVFLLSGSCLFVSQFLISTFNPPLRQHGLRLKGKVSAVCLPAESSHTLCRCFRYGGCPVRN